MNPQDKDRSAITEQGCSLLLEIGTEEIPARFLPPAISDLKRLASGLMDEYRIDHGEVKAYATPRRLVLIVNSVNTMQRDITKEIFGPSKKAAYDEHGNPTKAAIGFAQSLGINTSDLVIKQKGKGDYIVAVIDEKGVETRAVLPEVLEKIVLSLRFPKSMRWGTGTFTFARPMHWIMSLFGQDVIPFEIEGIKSGNITRGHRFLSPAAFQIRDISTYLSLLEHNFVLLDPEKRKDVIRKGITEHAVASGGLPLIDEELLETVSFLVEYPVPVLCSFDSSYLKLPKELLITVMKDHQKYFAIQDTEDNLVNHFVVVSNTRADNAGTIRVGAERVIRARFDDAKFYFHEDRKKTLFERVEDLKKVTFHAQLGSLFEKTGRMESIASFLADRLSPDLKEQLLRAARLSKTDLITGVVREFPELQGIMGKYYARHDEEEHTVSEALQEQYLPHSFGGKIPDSDVGALLSLSDKIDNISSFFCVGLIPTGSEDPFALRRQAIGIVNIILDKGYNITLGEIFGHPSLELAERKCKGNTYESIASFMEQRVEYILTSRGHDQTLIKCVLSLSMSCPLRTLSGRIGSLSRFRENMVFPEFLLAVKRANNIVPKTALPELREDLFVLEEEKTLFNSITQVKSKVNRLVIEEDFINAVDALAGVTGPVNTFFDKVLVMDKQEEIRLNRLSLLKEVWTTASMIADFSKLV